MISIMFSSGYKVKWHKKCCPFNGGASPISLRPWGLMLINRESSCKDFRYKAAILLNGCGCATRAVFRRVNLKSHSSLFWPRLVRSTPASSGDRRGAPWHQCLLFPTATCSNVTRVRFCLSLWAINMEKGPREWNVETLLCCTFYVPVKKQNIRLSVKASLFMPQLTKKRDCVWNNATDTSYRTMTSSCLMHILEAWVL